jgi:kynureninase
VSHYRAARVFEFFVEQALTPMLLREVSRHQVGLLARGFDALDLDPKSIRRDRDLPLEGLGGFLALTTNRAGELARRLRAADVWTDFRADVLRLGPAPYLADDQLERAVRTLGEVARAMSR